MGGAGRKSVYSSMKQWSDTFSLKLISLLFFCSSFCISLSVAEIYISVDMYIYTKHKILFEFEDRIRREEDYKYNRYSM